MGRQRTPEQKREQKRAVLIERTSRITGWTDTEVQERLSVGLTQAVRVNPLKGNPKQIVQEMMDIGWEGEPIDWCKDAKTDGYTIGYTITAGYEQLRDSELVTDGKVYIQNPSSWLPVVALDPQPGDRVLDVCAAPGGKSSHVAALLRGEGELVANDNSRPRLAKLQANLSRLGVSATYTLHDATRLAKHFEPESFDKILLDAPCSGEGLIDLHQPKTLDTWSVAHIRRLSDLQKKLLTQAWQLLKVDGELVYSTCTMAPEENEAVIDYILRRYDGVRVEPLDLEVSGALESWNGRAFDDQVQYAGRVFPADGQEAFFVCKLKKMA